MIPNHEEKGDYYVNLSMFIPIKRQTPTSKIVIIEVSHIKPKHQ